MSVFSVVLTFWLTSLKHKKHLILHISLYIIDY